MKILTFINLVMQFCILDTFYLFLQIRILEYKKSNSSRKFYTTNYFNFYRASNIKTCQTEKKYIQCMSLELSPTAAYSQAW